MAEAIRFPAHFPSLSQILSFPSSPRLTAGTRWNPELSRALAAFY
ncbi:unnamed protein product [Linum tenue]|uniref:Uncharacterized protein n=1 Tax=Linum tenue TaxID=586396 RepID=A0AAV0N299_9ROSI|nr:unnamed protein product [Linum tenue]CAI0544602.1 unnamed protein product [Linum tenue]